MIKILELEDFMEATVDIYTITGEEYLNKDLNASSAEGFASFYDSDNTVINIPNHQIKRVVLNLNDDSE